MGGGIDVFSGCEREWYQSPHAYATACTRIRANARSHTHTHTCTQNSLITTQRITPTSRAFLLKRPSTSGSHRPSTSESHRRRRPPLADRPSTGDWYCLCEGEKMNKDQGYKRGGSVSEAEKKCGAKGARSGAGWKREASARACASEGLRESA